MKLFGFSRSLAVAGLALCGIASGTAAEAAPTIGIQLNSAAPNAAACRLSFVINNGQDGVIDDLAMELVLFGKDGHVDRFIVVRTGKVPAGKSRVRQFDMAGVPCDGLSRVLLNDVKECSGAGLTPATCSDRIAVSSLAPIQFDN